MINEDPKSDQLKVLVVTSFYLFYFVLQIDS